MSPEMVLSFNHSGEDMRHLQEGIPPHHPLDTVEMLRQVDMPGTGLQLDMGGTPLLLGMELGRRDTTIGDKRRGMVAFKGDGDSKIDIGVEEGGSVRRDSISSRYNHASYQAFLNSREQ